MQLAKLEMVGFKSFADKTEFKFEPGVTAFVGPNGCGKSNVVDAVRWILGEQSAKAVRGKEMADVIFKGTDRRRSLGYAEASLTILNSENDLPVDYEEVCITRRLYRSGESEYLLNRQPCRLRDIRELLMDTGVGATNYYVIEQGKVDRVLQANPQERRVVFEEAAGISRYKAQRKETSSKLERTRDNIYLAQQILAEKEKQLRSVRYQAAKARRYCNYCERLKDLSIKVSLRDYEDLVARRDEARAKIEQAEAGERALMEQIATREAELARMQETVAQLERSVETAQSRIHDLDSRSSAAGEWIRTNRQRVTEFEEAASDAASSAGELGRRIEATQAEIESRRRELDRVREEARHAHARLKDGAGRIEQAESELAESRRDLEAMHSDVFDAVRAQSGLRNEIVLLERGRRLQWSRVNRLQEERRAVARKLNTLTEDESALAHECQRLAGQVGDGRARLAANEEELKRLEAERESTKTELRRQHQAEAKRDSRRQVLRELELRAEGVEKGVCRLLRGASVPEGIRGMVADLLRVPMPYAAAIEAALGERAQWVVTRDVRCAAACLDLLREEKSGRAAVLPLNRLQHDGRAGGFVITGQGVVAPAARLVAHPAGLGDLVWHLLGNVLVVDSLQTALDLSDRGLTSCRMVTLQGEVVEPCGAIVGGEGLAPVGLISRKSELEVLEHELQEITRTIARLEWRDRRSAERAEGVRAESRAIQQSIEDGKLQRVAAESGLEQHGRERQRLGEQDDVAVMEIEDAERNIHESDRQEQGIRAELERARKREEALKTRVEAADQELQEREESAAQLRRDLVLLQNAHTEKRERQARLEAVVADLDGSLADLAMQRDNAQRQAAAYRQKREETQRAIEKREQELAEIRAAREKAVADLARVRGEREQRHQEELEHHAEIRRLHGIRSESTDRLQKLRLAENEDRMRIESLVERIGRDFEVNLADLAGDIEASEGQNWEEVRAEIESLEQKVNSMRGTVNTDTIQEEAELELSVTQHSQHRDDLLAAEKQLREVIRRLNRISRERFAATFEQVRVNFQEIFRKLFGGGQADISLDPECDDILEAGIEIVACPPGKKRQPLSLLSGGEKTMTTVALLFAIFKSKPSPFCILDEIDAALDDKNIDRFVAMVQDFLKDSQFVVITHSRRTMTIADVLYGITMEEKGVSKKVAVKLDGVREKVA